MSRPPSPHLGLVSFDENCQKLEKSVLFAPHHPRPAYSLSLEIYFYCAKRENIKSFPFSLRIYLATRSNLECLNNPSALAFISSLAFKAEAECENKPWRGYFHSLLSAHQFRYRIKKSFGVVCHERLFPCLRERCKQDEARHAARNFWLKFRNQGG